VKLHDEVHQNLVTDDVENNDPSEELQSKNLEHSYQQVLAAMPEKRREVFLASRFDGLKYAEIADKMGISLKTVETHMSAAIKQLKDGLKDYI
jgi:RNA polymerase sigma-70 factor (ECF subfamily)